MAFQGSFGERPGERIPVQYQGQNLQGQKLLNSSSVFNTNPIVLHGAARIGLFINISAEDGSSGTLDIDLEFSPDKGTTYVDLPQGINTETLAVMAQFTEIGSKYKWWEIVADMTFGRIRAELTQGTFTTTTGFTYGPCFWIIGRR